MWLTLEIEPKHQSFVQNHVAPRTLVDVIYEATGAKVCFPDNVSHVCLPPPSSPSCISFFNSSISPPSPLGSSARMIPSPDACTSSRRSFYAPRLCQFKQPPPATALQHQQSRFASPFLGEEFQGRSDLRTMVTINGSVDGVFAARQFLMVNHVQGYY